MIQNIQMAQMLLRKYKRERGQKKGGYEKQGETAAKIIKKLKGRTNPAEREKITRRKKTRERKQEREKGESESGQGKKREK